MKILVQSNLSFKIPTLGSGSITYYSRKVLHTPFLIYSAVI